MEQSTLLAAIWATDGDDAAEKVRAQLESGDLVLTGNFRNEPASYWKKEEDNG